MIKAYAEGRDGKKVVLLGVSAANVEHLVAGEPILARLDELGIPGIDNIEVVIHYGETEAAILAEMRAAGVQLRANT